MTHFSWGVQRLTICTLGVSLAITSAGCRSGITMPRVPGMGWLSWNKEKYDTDGWASYDGSPEAASPSAAEDPTNLSVPETSSAGRLANNISGSSNQRASYEANEWSYPRTSNPNPFAGLEAASGGEPPSAAGYERVARRDEPPYSSVPPTSTSLPPQQGSMPAWPQSNTGLPPSSPSSPTPPPEFRDWQQPPYSSEGSPAGPPSSSFSAGANPSLPPWNPPQTDARAAEPAQPASSATPDMAWGDWPPPSSTSNAAVSPPAEVPTSDSFAPPRSWSEPGVSSQPMDAGAGTQTPPRNDVPWRPGSTSDYVPSGQTGAGAESVPQRAFRPNGRELLGQHSAPAASSQTPLVLAVDDGFPRTLYR